MIIDIVFMGLVSGGIYALLAVGFSLTFGVARIMNLAHTAFYMVGAFFVFIGVETLGLDVILASILAIIITIFIGVACYRLLFDRTKEQEIAVMIISVAAAMLFQESLTLIFTGQYHRVPPFAAGFVEMMGRKVSFQHLVAFGVCAVSFGGLWMLLKKTKLGNAIRVVSQDREMAGVMGINVSRVNTITVGISAGLAGIGGAVIAPIHMVSPEMWIHPLIIVLAAVVLGGLGSIKGSLIGAFTLGFAESAVVFTVPEGSFLKGAVSMAVMLIVLYMRPSGFFGVVFEEEAL